MINLRKFLIGLALTAAFGFAGLGIVNDTGSSDLQAGVGHWWTDTDVG